uniref:Bis(5'-nucleosyl)-tetraphosphatase [asymmetrical] n=1 Tax=Globodera pallida TaxID=36090 RepID=A0A183C102_GLOPA
MSAQLTRIDKCDPKKFTKKPHPAVNTSYLYCNTDGTLAKRDCPAGKQFNAEMLECEQASVPVPPTDPQRQIMDAPPHSEGNEADRIIQQPQFQAPGAYPFPSPMSAQLTRIDKCDPKKFTKKPHPAVNTSYLYCNTDGVNKRPCRCRRPDPQRQIMDAPPHSEGNEADRIIQQPQFQAPDDICTGGTPLTKLGAPVACNPSISSCPDGFLCTLHQRTGTSYCCQTAVDLLQESTLCSGNQVTYFEPLTGLPQTCALSAPSGCPTGFGCNLVGGSFTRCCGRDFGCPANSAGYLHPTTGSHVQCNSADPLSCPSGFLCTQSSMFNTGICCSDTSNAPIDICGGEAPLVQPNPCSASDPCPMGYGCRQGRCCPSKGVCPAGSPLGSMTQCSNERGNPCPNNFQCVTNNGHQYCCPSPDHVCGLPKDPGIPCQARGVPAVSRFFFDGSTGTCRSFQFSQCAGNANNFDSLEQCEGFCFETQCPQGGTGLRAGPALATCVPGDALSNAHDSCPSHYACTQPRFGSNFVCCSNPDEVCRYCCPAWDRCPPGASPFLVERSRKPLGCNWMANNCPDGYTCEGSKDRAICCRMRANQLQCPNGRAPYLYGKRPLACPTGSKRSCPAGYECTSSKNGPNQHLCCSTMEHHSPECVSGYAFVDSASGKNRICEPSAETCPIGYRCKRSTLANTHVCCSVALDNRYDGYCPTGQIPYAGNGPSAAADDFPAPLICHMALSPCPTNGPYHNPYSAYGGGAAAYGSAAGTMANFSMIVASCPPWSRPLLDQNTGLGQPCSTWVRCPKGFTCYSNFPDGRNAHCCTTVPLDNQVVFRANSALAASLAEGLNHQIAAPSSSLDSENQLNGARPHSAAAAPFSAQFFPPKYDKTTPPIGNNDNGTLTVGSVNATAGNFAIDMTALRRWERCPPNMVNIGGMCKRMFFLGQPGCEMDSQCSAQTNGTHCVKGYCACPTPLLVHESKCVLQCPEGFLNIAGRCHDLTSVVFMDSVEQRDNGTIGGFCLSTVVVTEQPGYELRIDDIGNRTEKGFCMAVEGSRFNGTGMLRDFVADDEESENYQKIVDAQPMASAFYEVTFSSPTTAAASSGEVENEQLYIGQVPHTRLRRPLGRNGAGQPEYLLLQVSYDPFHWTPPKGHVDPGEDEWTAAIRETSEEAGIDVNKLNVHKEFMYEMRYLSRSIKYGEEQKKVTYWLAEATDPEVNVVLSDEHQNWKWAELKSALELARFDEMKKLLNKAETYISECLQKP